MSRSSARVCLLLCVIHEQTLSYLHPRIFQEAWLSLPVVGRARSWSWYYDYTERETSISKQTPESLSEHGLTLIKQQKNDYS